LNLVDPDNRREVDYAARTALTAKEGVPRWADWLRDWRSGEIKLRVTQALLRFRAAHIDLFQRGDYQPLETKGRFSDRCVAFMRTYETEKLIVIVPRLTSRLGSPPLGLVWDDTAVDVELGSSWKDILTGQVLSAQGELPLEHVFAKLPLGVLARQ